MQFDFTLPAFGGQKIDVMGRFVKYVSGTGKIRVTLNKGGFVDLLPGQGVNGIEFDSMVVSDRTGNGGVGVLLAGAFAFQDDRISGQVEVIDGGRYRTLAGLTYTASGYTGGAVPGQKNVTQFWNPAGSGKRMVVASLAVMNFTGVGNMDLAFASAPLATLSPYVPNSKRTGGPASVIQMRTQIMAMASVVPGSGAVMHSMSSTGPYFRDSIKFEEPLLVEPGYGIHMLSPDAQTVTLMPEWYEEAI